jgi:hypothetical protein
MSVRGDEGDAGGGPDYVLTVIDSHGHPDAPWGSSGGDPEIEYREGTRVLRGSLESQWSLAVSVNRAWEPPHAEEAIPPEKWARIRANILAALEAQGYYYYHF